VEDSVSTRLTPPSVLSWPLYVRVRWWCRRRQPRRQRRRRWWPTQERRKEGGSCPRNIGPLSSSSVRRSPKGPLLHETRSLTLSLAPSSLSLSLSSLCYLFSLCVGSSRPALRQRQSEKRWIAFSSSFALTFLDSSKMRFRRERGSRLNTKGGKERAELLKEIDR